MPRIPRDFGRDLALLIFVLLAPPLLASGPAEPGGAGESMAPGDLSATMAETRANLYLQGRQEEATITALADGGAVMVWASARQERGSGGLYARRFDAAGRPTGGEVHVNQTLRGLQHQPAVTVAPGAPEGGAETVWIVWRSEGQDGEAGAIVARRFDGRLAPLGGEIAVNTRRRGEQGSPVVAALGEGVVIVWASRESAEQGGLRARRFDSGGRPLGGELVLSEGIGDHHPVVVAGPWRGASPERTLVVWVPGGERRGLVSRWLTAEGGLTAPEPWLTDRPGAVIEPSLALHAEGRGVLAWLEDEGAGYAVRWSRLGPGKAHEPRSGIEPVGPVARLAGSERGWQSGVAVAMEEGGAFSLVWGGELASERDTAQGGHRAEPALFVRRFDPEGRPLGSTDGILSQGRALSVASGAPRLVETGDGNLRVAWQGEMADDGSAVGLLRWPVGPEPTDPEPTDPAMGRPSWEAAQSTSRDFERANPPIWDPDHTPRPRRPELEGAGGDFGFEAIPSTGWTPPDPEMAVGPERLVGITNGAIAVFDKLGNLQWQDEIENTGGFWGELGADNFVFDPEVTWDPHARRFFAMANEDSDDNRPYFLLAVSKDERPDDRDDWWKYRLDVTGLAGAFIDSPNLAVGRDSVLLTADFFSPDRYLVYLVDKSSVLGGGVPITTSETIVGQQSMGVPVVRSDTGTLYILESTESGLNSLVRIHAITEPFTNYQRQVFELTVPEYGFPADPPQQGTSTRFELFEPRFWSVAEYGGALWAVHHVDQTRARVRWYELDLGGWPVAEGGIPSVAQWGELDLGGGIFTYFPSLHVDGAGNAAITFARSATNEFPSMGRALRAAGDPPGTFRPVQVVQTSPTFTTASRWGDYSGTQAEPDIPGTFWGHHEFLAANGSWSTWMARYTLRLEPMLLTADPPVSGVTTTLQVTGATPGELVFFYAGDTGSGLTEVPGLDVVLSVASASELGSALANGSGVATLVTTLPGGDQVVVQAAEPGLTTDFHRLVADSPLFADDFESGDTSVWSVTVP